MNKVQSELAWQVTSRRGRPPKSKVDLFRERVLRTVVAQLPAEAPQCRFDRSSVLRGGALTRAREARIAEHFPVFADAARWPLHLLETRETRRSRLMQLIETYECEPSFLGGLLHQRRATGRSEVQPLQSLRGGLSSQDLPLGHLSKLTPNLTLITQCGDRSGQNASLSQKFY